jgi:hypothetical protein
VFISITADNSHKAEFPPIFHFAGHLKVKWNFYVHARFDCAKVKSEREEPAT